MAMDSARRVASASAEAARARRTAISWSLSRPAEAEEEKGRGAGDFWQDELPTGVDGILLSMVLHDWSQEEGLPLLQKCASALPRGGKILIYEQLLDEDLCGPATACLTNLLMLLRTRSGAEYSESQYRDIRSRAGFGSIGVIRTPGLRQLIHAVRL